MLKSILRLYVAVTSCKKSDKFQTLIFHKLEKTHFGPFLQEKPETRFFLSKNRGLPLFITLHPNSMQKIEKLWTDKQTHRQIDKRINNQTNRQ